MIHKAGTNPREYAVRGAQNRHPDRDDAPDFSKNKAKPSASEKTGPTIGDAVAGDLLDEKARQAAERDRRGC